MERSGPCCQVLLSEIVRGLTTGFGKMVVGMELSGVERITAQLECEEQMI